MFDENNNTFYADVDIKDIQKTFLGKKTPPTDAVELYSTETCTSWCKATLVDALHALNVRGAYTEVSAEYYGAHLARAPFLLSDAGLVDDYKTIIVARPPETIDISSVRPETHVDLLVDASRLTEDEIDEDGLPTQDVIFTPFVLFWTESEMEYGGCRVAIFLAADARYNCCLGRPQTTGQKQCFIQEKMAWLWDTTAVSREHDEWLPFTLWDGKTMVMHMVEDESIGVERLTVLHGLRQITSPAISPDRVIEVSHIGPEVSGDRLWSRVFINGGEEGSNVKYLA